MEAERSRALEPGDFEDARRGEPRVRVARSVDVLPCRATKEWSFLTAELIDCSRSGLALLLDEPMHLGSQFLVKLRVGGSIKLLIYTVHNCVHWERARYRVGARFSGLAATEVNEDPDRILEALIKGE